MTTNITKMRRYNGGGLTRVTELVRPEEIKEGDRVLVEVEVVSVQPTSPSGSLNHIYARVPRDLEHPWQMAEHQRLWTWGWSGASNVKIERLR